MSQPSSLEFLLALPVEKLEAGTRHPPQRAPAQETSANEADEYSDAKRFLLIAIAPLV